MKATGFTHDNKNNGTRLTDDQGKSTQKPEGAHPVTPDGRLLWVGPIESHEVSEFILDGCSLGNITLDAAMCMYLKRKNNHEH